MQRNSGLEAIIKAKCPQCREGNMFQYPLIRVDKFSKMNTYCPNCKLRFEVEPGFFIGAMYISYAFSIGIFLILGLSLYHIFGDPELWVYLATIPTSVVVLMPFIFRYSRVLFLHWFGGVSFQKQQGGL
ncbi:DUF983 domain-containing protein [Fulvivirgaceae bacterium BMA10]|uniref:DUF983 domain-containing protein n=1 Tax=Splendidivirga corallicola TaxID=3051826 RepID=A0ABT8KS65_9BACT|nr:DUF983 domain-containing protein [Fulvivirgaceae bacterium BMA10]